MLKYWEKNFCMSVPFQKGQGDLPGSYALKSSAPHLGIHQRMVVMNILWVPQMSVGRWLAREFLMRRL